MCTACGISFTADGKLDIFRDDKLVYASVPISWLECYLASHGIGGEDYRYVIDQLNDAGKASIKIPSPSLAR